MPYKSSGTVEDQGSGIERRVAIFRKDTLAKLAEAQSDPSTGAFEIEHQYGGECLAVCEGDVDTLGQRWRIHGPYLPIQVGDPVVILDISNPSYDSVSFDFSSESTDPTGITFSSDGVYMFITGSVGNTIYRYSLSIAWDIATASYSGVSRAVGGVAGNLRAVIFTDDGLRMFVVDASSEAIYQFTCPAAWDIVNATYDSVSFSLSNEMGGPQEAFFRPDGSQFYVIDAQTDTVYQYSLSTAWDLSTASYDSVSFSVGSEDATPLSVFFQSDGERMFITGRDTTSLYQYSLSTAWDISTATYESVSFDVGTEDSEPYDAFFAPSGDRLFVMGRGSDSVHQYTLS